MEQITDVVSPIVAAVPAEVSALLGENSHCHLLPEPHVPMVGAHVRSYAGGPQTCSTRLTPLRKAGWITESLTARHFISFKSVHGVTG